MYNEHDGTNGDDPDTNPLQLTAGNSDLYKYGNVSGSPAQKRITSLNEGRSEGVAEITPEDFRTDLVYYYYFEGFNKTDSIAVRGGQATGEIEYVSEFVLPEKVGDVEESYSKMIETIDGTDIDTWLAADNRRSIEVVEAVAADQHNEAGPNSAKLYSANKANETYTDGNDHIEPSHSTKSADYATGTSASNDPTTSNIVRNIEYYTITYKVTDENGALYVGSRRVKLTYLPGDANLDGTVNAYDKTPLGLRLNGKYQSVYAEDGTPIEAITLAVMDTDGSGGINAFDKTPLALGLNGMYKDYNIRWIDHVDR